MSKFYGRITSEIGKQVTKIGHTELETECNSWADGCEARFSVNEDGKEILRIHLTNGSGCGGKHIQIAEFIDGKIAFLAKKKDFKAWE